MLRRHAMTLLTAVLAFAPLTSAHAQPAADTPLPFGKYIVYSAAAVYDPAVPPAEGDLAQWFHREVMGRDDAALAAERATGDSYFSNTFGALYTPGLLVAFGLDPRVAYTAYFVSGAAVPPEGWVVRDGGFQAILSDGTLVVYGDYNIAVTARGRGRGATREPIVIHYESVDPIHFHADGAVFFRCRLRSDSFDDFGGGLAQGVSASQTLPDGRVVSNIRNVLTFPGLGFGVR